MFNCYILGLFHWCTALSNLYLPYLALFSLILNREPGVRMAPHSIYYIEIF